MKRWIPLILGVVLFIIAGAGIVVALSRVCIPYTAKADKIEKTLYSDDADISSVDVCLIGGSHGLNAFNPSAMWDESHIKAYNFCYAGETVALTKLYLTELYKKRNFDVVVFDIYYAGLDDRYFGETDYCYDVVNKMHMDADVISYIDKNTSKAAKSGYYFPLVRYHTRWLDLTENDIKRAPDPSDDWILGGDYHYEVNSGSTVYFNKWSDKGFTLPLSDDIEQDLRDIIELVQSHGSTLILADLPRKYNDSLAPAKWTKDEYATVNRVREIADEYGVELLQYDSDGLAEIGFIPEEHMFNKGHMNIAGSEVYSRALARHIVSNCDVKTYDDGDEIWDEYYEKYSSLL